MTLFKNQTYFGSYWPPSPPPGPEAVARRAIPLTDVSSPRTAIDPVCGMTVVIGDGTPHAVVDGVEHWFCCAGCRDRFTAA